MPDKLSREELLRDLRDQENKCWQMADVFMRRGDPHGLHDIGVEIESIRRAIHSVEKVAVEHEG